MSNDGLEVLGTEVTSLEVDDNALVDAFIVSQVAEGKPFVLLTVDAGEDEKGNFVSVKVMSDLPPEMLNVVLTLAQDQVDRHLANEE